MRAMTNRDIATGTVSTTDNQTYSSKGTPSTWQYKNEVPDSPAPTCYVRALLATCTEDQVGAVLNGTALVHNWIVVDNNTATLSNGTVSNGTSSSNGTTSGDRPSTPSSSASSGTPSGSSKGSSAGGSTPSNVSSTGEGFTLEVQYSSIALVLAIAVALVL